MTTTTTASPLTVGQLQHHMGNELLEYWIGLLSHQIQKIDDTPSGQVESPSKLEEYKQHIVELRRSLKNVTAGITIDAIEHRNVKFYEEPEVSLGRITLRRIPG